MRNADGLVQEISSASDEFAKRINGLAGTDANLRQGVLKSALREVVWSIAAEFPDEKYEIADFLDLMSGLVREKESEEC